MKKVINDLMREAKRQGAEVSLTRNGHWRVRLPSGKVIFAPQSPSDYQSTWTVRRKLRRGGLDF